jgi:putative ABC transport system permease protein
MSFLNRIGTVMRNLFHRERVERDLDAEVRSYADLLQEEKMSHCMNADEAKRAARMSMVGPEQLKEELRGARAGAWLESFWKDLRYGARMLRKNPRFTAVAILTLALGIGANTAVFSVVNAVVLRPLPYKDSSRLVDVTTSTAMFPTFTLGNSWIAFEQMRKDANAFESLAAYRQSRMTLTGSGDPARLYSIRVADGFFEQFGVTPQVGRLLVPEDQTENQGHVAVLSDAFWRSHFGADASVVGRTIRLNNTECVVVGIAASGFVYPDRSDLWVPLVLAADERLNATSFNNSIIGKLRRRATVSQARSQLAVIAQNIITANPALKEGYELRAATVLDRKVGRIRSSYLMLFGAAGFVLLIACANLASLLLARGSGRRREMAMRAALGASSGRIVRQSLVESCLLGLLGGTAGAVFASIGVSSFRQMAPAYIPRLNEITPDSTMFWFALGSSLVAGILFGLAPALHAARSDPNSALKDGVGGSVSEVGSAGRPKLGGVLVISEVALAFILLIGAVVTTEGLSKLLKTETGMRTDHLLSFDLPSAPITEKNVDAAHARIRNFLDRVHAIPGVVDVTATDHVVLGGSISMYSGFTVEGDSAPHSTADRSAQVRYVAPSYFQMLGVHLIRGRFFTDRDVSNSEKVAIVNEAMAQKLWGTVDALGKRFHFGANDNKEWTSVAGVIANTRDVGLSAMPQPEFYFPILQGSADTLNFIVRTAQDPAALAPTISREIWNVDKNQPITNIQTVAQIVREETGDSRMSSALLSFFGAIGLGLALLGVYGVVAYSVSRRTREIGIRMALGANRYDVLRMVIRQGLLLALIGVAIGTAGAIALRQILQNNFTVANTNDAATYLVAGVLVIVVACLACYVPARRAMRVDPMIALRHE